MRSVRRTGVLVAAATLLVACTSSEPDITPITGDGDEAPPAEAADPPSPTSGDGGEDPDEPEADDDPFAVPDDIDEAYLQSVADELMVIRTDAVRYAVANNGDLISPDEELVDLIGSVYTGDELTPQLNNVSDILRAANVDEVFLAPDAMQDQRFEIVELLGGDDDCLTVTGRFDLTPTSPDASDPARHFLAVLQHLPDQPGTNVTGWQFFETRELLTADGEPITDEAVAGQASIEDASGIVDTTCGGDDEPA